MTDDDETPAPETFDDSAVSSGSPQGMAAIRFSRHAAGGRLWIVLAAVMWSSSGLFAKAPIFDT
ncbi:MAG: hypothetical protein HY288_13270, partial [Planctomycetia bacterium]|nr:hypothetical protein [Planctomycetia bacterium]